jgi:hypothetical protein
VGYSDFDLQREFLIASQIVELAWGERARAVAFGANDAQKPKSVGIQSCRSPDNALRIPP